MATVSSSSSSLSSSLVSTTKFRVLGFQRLSTRSEISSISISKLQSKASPSSSSAHLLVSSSFRFGNVKSSSKIMKQRMPVLFANPSSEGGGDIVKGGEAEATTTTTTEPQGQGQGPPILTILAGFALFFLIAWIVGSIVMWLLAELTVGMEKEVLKAGNGPKPVRGQSVTVHCTGFGKNGDLSQKFWSTKDPGQTPFTFKIGLGSVIKGWDEGVMGMQVGEVARLRCSPEYAYGSGGFPAWGILPNAVLVFEIEVLSCGSKPEEYPMLSWFSKLKS